MILAAELLRMTGLLSRVILFQTKNERTKTITLMPPPIIKKYSFAYARIVKKPTKKVSIISPKESLPCLSFLLDPKIFIFYINRLRLSNLGLFSRLRSNCFLSFKSNIANTDIITITIIPKTLTSILIILPLTSYSALPIITRNTCLYIKDNSHHKDCWCKLYTRYKVLRHQLMKINLPDFLNGSKNSPFSIFCNLKSIREIDP